MPKILDFDETARRRGFGFETDVVLPFETAVKTARRWGYDVKGVPEDRAKIVTGQAGKGTQRLGTR